MNRTHRQHVHTEPTAARSTAAPGRHSRADRARHLDTALRGTQTVTAAWHRHRSTHKAAESLGLPKSTLANLIEQLGVKKVGNR